VGASRGKGNAERLLEGYIGVRVTDFYPAYDKLPGHHQGCWSHVIRKPKELSEN